MSDDRDVINKFGMMSDVVFPLRLGPSTNVESLFTARYVVLMCTSEIDAVIDRHFDQRLEKITRVLDIAM